MKLRQICEGKRKNTLILMSYMGSLSHNLAKLEHEEKEIHKRSFLKLTISSFLIFLCFYFFAFMKFWPQLDGKYKRQLLSLFMCDLIIIKGKMKPSSYGLMAKFALHAKCLEGGNKS